MKYTLKFGKTTFAVTVPASVSSGEEVVRYAHEALRAAAERARSENRTLLPLEVLQALRKAVTSRWVGATVNMES